MGHRFRTSTAIVAAVIGFMSLAAISAAAQNRSSAAAADRTKPALAAKTALAAKPWTPPKTPWGDPDLQGIYTSDDLIGTPIERPAALGERLYRTEEELAQQEARIAKDAAADLQEFVAPGARVTRGPPSHWTERPRRPVQQTSLIVDPPNGRIPPLTPLGQKREAVVTAKDEEHAASWEDFSYYIRCITRGLTGSIFPSMYDNGTQIIQAPGYVTILHEKVHEARIIPLDNRPHVGQNVRSYLGDSRGHWEGNTLVIETTNFFDNRVGIGSAGEATPTSDALRLVERFTRVAPDRMQYEVTIDDPKTFTKPWKVAFPITQEPGYQLFEYTCHEANYAMTNSLSAARAQEKAEAAKQKE